MRAERMIRIGSSATGNAYLPEHQAYIEYFSGIPDIDFVDVPRGAPLRPGDFDFEWKYAGLDLFWRPAGIPVIHEYNSLSTGAFPHLRNLVKRFCNRQPALRVFLMPEVRNELGFNDGVPSVCRGMGVDDAFFLAGRPAVPAYDLVYCGSITRSRHVHRLLHAVRARGLSILVVGEPEPAIYQEFRDLSQIAFTGRMSRRDIPALLVQARWAVNITPDRYPFNLQESTKVLEYCAAGLPIITNSYPWIRTFERASGGRFLDLRRDFTGLDRKQLETFAFVTPDVAAYRWRAVMERSGLVDAIRSLR